jgi:exopolysaccharide production protein ExoZ
MCVVLSTVRSEIQVSDTRQSGTPSAPQPRIRSVQEFRAIAALMVVACHIASVCEKYCVGPNAFLENLHWWGALGVDFFFIISGLVIYQVASHHVGGIARASRFLYRRVSRVYPTYWVYTTLALIVFLRRPGLINGGTLTHASILPSYLLSTASHGLLLMQAWTLVFEVMFYISFAGLILIARTRRYLDWLLSLWALAIIATALILHQANGPWLGLNLQVIEFLLGCLIGNLLQRNAIRAGWGLFLAAFGILGTIAATTAVIFEGTTSDQILTPTVRVSGFGLSFASIVLGVIALEQAGKLSRRPFMEAIGDWSYSIYLAHIFIINGVFRFGVAVIPHLATPVGAVVLSIAGASAAILFGWASYNLLEKPLLRITGRAADWIW